ncbi:coatomer subunit delta-like, partial [Ostrinia furnacalis]|uniref:coatomer subunit delta-like n=1 Tax=Ostrinia furnacalis TaxID=93504 RepID=UPI00103D89EE
LLTLRITDEQYGRIRVHVDNRDSRSLQLQFRLNVWLRCPPVNCWPSEGAGGGCDVNIEYELEHDHLSLNDVNIHIPLPSGNISLVVHQWEGSYAQKGRTLIWSVPIINKQQKTGSLEFTVTPAIPNDFFPLSVTWTSDTTMCLLSATGVSQAEGGAPVDFSHEVALHPDKYEIV